MFGVRFTAVCAIVAGMIVVASPTDAAIKTKHATTAESKGAKRAADRSRSAKRHRHGEKHAHAHKRGRERKEAARQTAAARQAPAAPAIGADPAAIRRFRAFVNPELLAANPVEQLRGPKMDASHFSLQVAYPLMDSADAQPATASPAPVPVKEEPEPPDPAVGVERTVRIDQPGGTVPTGTADASLQTSVATAEIPSNAHGHSESSWLRAAFLTWGGLLALGSAFRMLTG